MSGTSPGRRGMRTFVCYIPGLDARRITPDVAPRIHAIRADYPTAALTTLPSVELLPTMLTGVYPHQHGVWQVTLRPDFDWRRPKTMFERLPESLTTIVQGFEQMRNASFDLSTVPPHRRRGFQQYRFKYTRREASDETIIRFGEYDTLLGMLGSRARYAFAKRFDKAHGLLDGGLLEDDADLLLLELYALDLFQHWHLDDAEAMNDALRETDAFVQRLEKVCASRNLQLMILVDHGQEPIVGTIPLQEALDRVDVPQNEFSYFMEVAQCRFWFHTDRARTAIHELLERLPNCAHFRYDELGPYHLHFPDDRWGETYAMADAGYIFFPHDFYRPLANFYLGLADSSQRPRIWNPRHRGNHGYLPTNPSEMGFMTLLDDRSRTTRDTGELIDVAPTILDLIGMTPPEYMKGTSLFAR